MAVKIYVGEGCYIMLQSVNTCSSNHPHDSIITTPEKTSRLDNKACKLFSCPGAQSYHKEYDDESPEITSALLQSRSQKTHALVETEQLDELQRAKEYQKADDVSESLQSHDTNVTVCSNAMCTTPKLVYIPNS